ncbi:Ubiquitin-like-specific protease ESD4 [Glycine soja]
MGAMTINRKRPEECMNVNHTNSDSQRKRAKFSTKPVPSATSAVARLSRYPEVHVPLAREVHAPCRQRKFERARVSVSVSASDAMGNVLAAKFKEAKRSAAAKCRILVEEGKEVTEVDAETESEGRYENSSVEGAGGDGDKVVRVQQQSQSTLSFDSEVTNAKLKVASGEKVWGYETQRDLENVHVYKKLLEDVGRRSDTLQRLNFEIDLHEKRRDYYNLVRPKKELVEEEEVRQEPFVALTSEEEDEVERAFSANRWRILVTLKNSNIEITGEKFQCLRPAGWLNDELISGPKGYDFKSVRRWTSQRNLGYSLLECDKIFVPIHQEIHWCLAVINKKDKKFQYLDSMKGEDSFVLEKLAKYFADEVNDKTGKHIDVNTWKKEFVKDLPQQKNGYDCGVFMIKYADFYSRGLELCFNQENMSYFRCRTAKEILRLKAE